jgi:lipopolysaccharide/colanic/teichoic acid biosynthesis glycosyltransferase
MTRRLVDLAIGVVGIALLWPLLLLIAALVRIDSPGSPFYGGWRIGKDGRPFRMWKFRTMVQDADRLGPSITAKEDARVTCLGRYLRQSRLDELPQLFNLLTGDVTLVGPRPEVPDIVERYTPEQRQVLEFKPGITGPGQIYYTTYQEDSVPEGAGASDYYVSRLLAPKLRIDLEYMQKRTALSDLRVMLQTAGIVVKGLARPSA